MVLTARNLIVVPYSEYLSELHDKIETLHNEGLGYKRIVHWLNENGYQTLRGEKFYNNHVYLILKKNDWRISVWIKSWKLNKKILVLSLQNAISSTQPNKVYLNLSFVHRIPKTKIFTTTQTLVAWIVYLYLEVKVIKPSNINMYKFVKYYKLRPVNSLIHNTIFPMNVKLNTASQNIKW